MLNSTAARAARHRQQASGSTYNVGFFSATGGGQFIQFLKHSFTVVKIASINVGQAFRQQLVQFAGSKRLAPHLLQSGKAGGDNVFSRVVDAALHLFVHKLLEVGFQLQCHGGRLPEGDAPCSGIN